MPSSATDKVPEVRSIASDRRRTNKPVMEKKRRQRINDCLNQLKSLVLEAMKKDPSKYNKLEKADILEMTVRHVQNLHRQEANANSRPLAAAEGATKFLAGFVQCASEVRNYVESEPMLNTGLKGRLLGHLTQSISRLQTDSCTTGVQVLHDVTETQLQSDDVTSFPSPPPFASGEVTFLPTRLPSGQIALLMSRGSNSSPVVAYHFVPPSPPGSSSSSPPPSPCRSPSPQPLDLAPIRPAPSEDSCWRPW